MSGAWWPTVEDVAGVLRARTKPTDGQTPAGTFNDNTRPTGTEVEDLISQAAALVEAAFAGDVPESSGDDARQATLLRTAQWIEISYFPEQLDDQDAAVTLAQQADIAMSSLVKTSNVRAFIESADLDEAA